MRLFAPRQDSLGHEVFVQAAIAAARTPFRASDLRHTIVTRKGRLASRATVIVASPMAVAPGDRPYVRYERDASDPVTAHLVAATLRVRARIDDLRVRALLSSTPRTRVQRARLYANAAAASALLTGIMMLSYAALGAPPLMTAILGACTSTLGVAAVWLYGTARAIARRTPTSARDVRARHS